MQHSNLLTQSAQVTHSAWLESERRGVPIDEFLTLLGTDLATEQPLLFDRGCPSGLFALADPALRLQPPAHGRARRSGRPASGRRGLGRLVESFHRCGPGRCPIAELRARARRGGRDRRSCGAQHSVEHRRRQAGSLDGDRDGDRRVGRVGMLTTGPARASRDPRHRVGGDRQAPRSSMHAFDGFHRTIVPHHGLASRS